jgi:hypothetical protein
MLVIRVKLSPLHKNPKDSYEMNIVSLPRHVGQTPKFLYGELGGFRGSFMNKRTKT